MKICFGTIMLNEAQYLGLSLRQHLSFCDRWVIVEGADRLYMRERVSVDGLSTDGSSDIVRSHPDPDKKIHFIQHGWAADKQELRNRYAELADDCDVLVVIDVDEFLSNRSMKELLFRLGRLNGPSGAVRIPHVHLWKDHEHVIIGGYWDVPHDRAYKWLAGARYVRDHNHPERDGLLIRQGNTQEVEKCFYSQNTGLSHDEPFWLHFGNCKTAENIKDKNGYYLNRGEAVTRPNTVLSRDAWFGNLPEFCRIWRWAGPLPEVFQC